jgi:micrococcal nuclease
MPSQPTQNDGSDQNTPQPEDTPQNTPTPDDGTEDTPDDNEPIDSKFLPAEWIAAPDAHCNQVSNQVYADYIIDGDTVVLANGDRVRYIGVDAPELKHKDCWANESKDALMELTPVTQPICLLKDNKTKDKDSWGRLLRYVFVRHNDQWVMQNARLVRVGAAKAFHKYLKGTDYQSEFIQSEDNAHTETLGGWNACSSW